MMGTVLQQREDRRINLSACCPWKFRREGGSKEDKFECMLSMEVQAGGWFDASG
jgi:hypothetical protein